MKTLTIEIKVIKRIKIPALPEGYKRKQKLPMHLRTSPDDHLNVFSKSLPVHEDYLASGVWNKELYLLYNQLPFKIAKSPDYGDTLVGCITDVEFGDFYTELYLSKNWITQ